MNLFQLSEPELLCFFAVLVRLSTLISVLPFVGDKNIPMPVKILFSLGVSIAVFPSLVIQGLVKPTDAFIWSKTTGMLVATMCFEVLYALLIGFIAKLAFDSIHFCGNLVGNFMGFAMASTYDHNQETQTLVVSEFYVAIAMLVFLMMDGHHLMLKAALGSYEVLGIGGMMTLIKTGINQMFAERLIQLSQFVFQFGIQLAAPIALSLFAVNVVFGVISKALPQLNILVLSFSVTALTGLLVMYINIEEYALVSGQIGEKMYEWMQGFTRLLAGK